MTFANSIDKLTSYKQFSFYEDDCFNSVAWDARANGTGSSSAVIGSLPDHPGTFKLSTGTQSNGVASILYSSVVGNVGNYSLVTSKSFVYTALINIETLANVTDDYDFYIGQNDGWALAYPQNGCYFQYLRTTSANWLCVTNNNTTATSTTSSIAVSTGWHEMKIVGTPTSVKFYVDDVLAATNTTNLPTLTYNLNMMMIVKTAGTTSLNVYQDYFSNMQQVSR